MFPDKALTITDAKWCPRAQHWVTCSRFDKNARQADGLSTWCKDCRHDHNHVKDREPRNPLEQLKKQLGLRVVVSSGLTKVCRGCKRNLPKAREYFHCRERKGHNPDWYPYCRTCKRELRDRKRVQKVAT